MQLSLMLGSNTVVYFDVDTETDIILYSGDSLDDAKAWIENNYPGMVIFDECDTYIGYDGKGNPPNNGDKIMPTRIEVKLKDNYYDGESNANEGDTGVIIDWNDEHDYVIRLDTPREGESGYIVVNKDYLIITNGTAFPT